MLSNEAFVEQTLINNLFYLRSIREYCATVQLGFLSNNEEYINRAEEIAIKIENLGRTLVNFADGKLSQFVLDSGIFVTEYTLPCEELTEKLFGIKIATDITKKELEFKPGQITNVTNQMVEELKEANRYSLQLVSEFRALIREIYDKQSTSELFSYTYNAILRYMSETAVLFETILTRLINMDTSDPTFVADSEYWLNVGMKDIASFIRALVDPGNNDIFIKANSFYNEFSFLIEEYRRTGLSPDTQKLLTSKSLDVVNRFQTFIRDVIEKVLTSRAYFIIEPTFLDNMYTDINYFKYILTLNSRVEDS